MKILSTVFVAGGSGGGLINGLLTTLLIGICVLLIWWVGRWFITKLGAPAIVSTVWDGLFILVGLFVAVNFLLGLTGHALVNLELLSIIINIIMLSILVFHIYRRDTMNRQYGQRSMQDYYKVPMREVYCQTFSVWVMACLRCHVWLRVTSPVMTPLPKIGLIALLMSTFVFCGATCKNPSAAPIQAEGVVVTTVDAGMRGWAIYVQSGKATQAQIDAVKAAYNTYYNAQVIAESALEAYVSNGSTNSVDSTTAQASVIAAENSLLALLNQYLK
jgi:hypothetical protein